MTRRILSGLRYHHAGAELEPYHFKWPAWPAVSESLPFRKRTSPALAGAGARRPCLSLNTTPVLAMSLVELEMSSLSPSSNTIAFWPCFRLEISPSSQGGGKEGSKKEEGKKILYSSVSVRARHSAKGVPHAFRTYGPDGSLRQGWKQFGLLYLSAGLGRASGDRLRTSADRG